MKRIAMLALVLTPLSAQWIKIPTAGIPRTADGKPDLTAPVPRTADGKPDMSGLWRQPNGVKYTINLDADLKPGDVVMQPWAAALYKERQDNISKDDPVGYCNFPGVPQMEAVPYPYKIIYGQGTIDILYEAFHTFRQIFMDGRELPKDPNPTWFGYSVGRWDGDTLVVETAGMNDKTWIDTGGHPHSEALHVTERFTRKDFGHIDLQIRIDDPKAYTKPWTVTYGLALMPDTEMLEYVCNENNVDTKHLVGK
ncbi:MAG TPA: hypothetical protein VGN17_31430 [Bryobacteraceae bacterium]